MRRILVVVAAIAAVPAFGQGLGVTPAVPENSPLTITPQAGPWVICAASFCDQPRSEPRARVDAEAMANEIRGHYGLPAYVFNRTAEERRAEQERVARVKEEMQKKLAADGLPPDTRLHVKTVRIEDQYAVLVGGYKDDAIARKELERIRKLQPSDKFARYEYVPDPKTGKVREQAVSPFQSAFVCRNPTVPVEKPKQDAAEEIARLKQYNSSESYSLLKCSRPVTLAVRRYQGEAVVQAQSQTISTMERMNQERKFASVLHANANQAHQVAEFLRKFGVEAYVLHTEYDSFVTVGSFDSKDDPRLEQMRKWFINEMKNPNSNVGQMQTRAMVQFCEPLPMAVPQVK
jgi:hypothetical protein